MPWFVSVLISGLLQLMGSLAGRALVSLGFGFVEFVGINALVNQGKEYASSALAGLGAEGLVAWAGFFYIDAHLSVIASAITVKMTINALTGDRVRRLVQKV